MKAEFKVVRTMDFLKTKATGELNLEASKEVLSKLALLNIDGGNHEILIDIRDTVSVLTLSDIYELVTEVGKNRKAFRKKIAILLGPQHDIDKAKFLEMCAVNRGFNVNAFNDFEEAVCWLMEEIKLIG